MSKGLLLMVLLAGSMLPGSAYACTDGSNMKSYFFSSRPADVSGAVTLRVHLLNGDLSTIEAELVGSDSRLSTDGKIRIHLPEPPMTTNCVGWGDRGNPVFVVGVLQRYESGRLLLRAFPLRDASDKRPARSTADLDKYIVDPAYLPAKP